MFIIAPVVSSCQDNFRKMMT
ncbi:hypothetical protein [Helicobacter sp.]